MELRLRSREDFASSGDRTWSARSVGQRLTHWATGAPLKFRSKIDNDLFDAQEEPSE